MATYCSVLGLWSGREPSRRDTSALERSRGHLLKAQEFLLAGERDIDDALYNAAASNAVLAGINAKDAICLRLTGRTGKSSDHQRAVAELGGGRTSR